jgi:hypothetical protein
MVHFRLPVYQIQKFGKGEFFLGFVRFSLEEHICQLHHNLSKKMEKQEYRAEEDQRASEWEKAIDARRAAARLTTKRGFAAECSCSFLQITGF